MPAQNRNAAIAYESKKAVVNYALASKSAKTKNPRRKFSRLQNQLRDANVPRGRSSVLNENAHAERFMNFAPASKEIYTNKILTKIFFSL
jgi:hypothetical protein